MAKANPHLIERQFEPVTGAYCGSVFRFQNIIEVPHFLISGGGHFQAAGDAGIGLDPFYFTLTCGPNS